jgi:hypothetical protein
MTYFLMSTPWPITTESDSITIDRCYVHGAPNVDLQGAVQANWANTAVVDSDIREVHIKGFDSQAIGAFHSPGPFKIVNNHLEAAGENVMFGGSGQNFNPWVPSDIEIRNNHLFKPLSWAKAGISVPPNNSMVVKNAFELKSAQRVVFDNNLIENVWAAGQLGFAIVLTVRSFQSGDIAVVNDITITNNVLKNVVSGIGTQGGDDQCGKEPYVNCHNAGSQDRWYIANNLILFYDPALPGGNRNLALSIQPGYDRVNGHHTAIRNMVFEHNTTVPAASTPCWNSIYFGTAGQKPPISNITNNLWILDNVLCKPPTGDWGLQGTAGLTQYMGDPEPLETRFSGNVIYLPATDKVSGFPRHNSLSQKPLQFNAKFQLIDSAANSGDKKPPGFSPEGVKFPLP